ncbi:probable calcium-binding protein CML30 [Olea europaea var. sylvestris]|uniref:probable calcium-binding protein CML30 n=1 Tax=Olea europaea var. sylvestris TaxID=158386 RepID=UPI000C1D38D4|nr:probable calcium-binding protein CML30 [Olea europaea var. sylvestris]
MKQKHKTFGGHVIHAHSCVRTSNGEQSNKESKITETSINVNFQNTELNMVMDRLNIVCAEDGKDGGVDEFSVLFDKEPGLQEVRKLSMFSILGIEYAEDGGDESFSIDEFAALFNEEPSLQEIKESFDVFDDKKDGFIDANELQRVLCSLGLKEGCELEQCRRMITAFDGNGDGVIDFYDLEIQYISAVLHLEPAVVTSLRRSSSSMIH